MSTFTSTGTVKVRWSLAAPKKVDVFFVPDRNHSIQHDGRCYAVFVGDEAGSNGTLGSVVRAFAPECDSNGTKGILLETLDANPPAPMCGALAHAAAAQCKVKVKVKVKEEGNNVLQIKDITIPAP